METRSSLGTCRTAIALTLEVLRREHLLDCPFLLTNSAAFATRSGLAGTLGRPWSQRCHLADRSPLDADVGSARVGFARRSGQRSDPALVHRMDWRSSPIDRGSSERAAPIIAAAVGSAGIGRPRAPLGMADLDPPMRIPRAHHHVGTTRMHPDPRRSVADADCRLHGIANLFVAGRPVLPAVGYANPAVTLNVASGRTERAEHSATRNLDAERAGFSAFSPTNPGGPTRSHSVEPDDGAARSHGV